VLLQLTKPALLPILVKLTAVLLLAPSAAAGSVNVVPFAGTELNTAGAGLLKVAESGKEKVEVPPVQVRVPVKVPGDALVAVTVRRALKPFEMVTGAGAENTLPVVLQLTTPEVLPVLLKLTEALVVLPVITLGKVSVVPFEGKEEKMATAAIPVPVKGAGVKIRPTAVQLREALRAPAAVGRKRTEMEDV